MNWHEKLIDADEQMTAHARLHGEAKLQIMYYGDKDVVRKRMIISPDRIVNHYDKGDEDED